jgi:pimeloyl-ACP methyl ester carboxylesterase
MRQVLVKLLAENYEDQISRIGCPVELVWGDDDTEAPLAIAKAVHDAIPGSVLTVSPGAGHMTPQSVPELLRQAVDRALDAPVRAGAR